MRAKLILAVLAALAAGTARAMAEEAIKILWVRVETNQHATQVCRERFPQWPLTGIGGCYFRAGDVCYVVAPDPAVRTAANGRRWYEYNQWAALGHEVKHCFDGRFHD